MYRKESKVGFVTTLNAKLHGQWGAGEAPEQGGDCIRHAELRPSSLQLAGPSGSTQPLKGGSLASLTTPGHFLSGLQVPHP